MAGSSLCTTMQTQASLLNYRSWTASTFHAEMMSPETGPGYRSSCLATGLMSLRHRIQGGRHICSSVRHLRHRTRWRWGWRPLVRIKRRRRVVKRSRRRGVKKSNIEYWVIRVSTCRGVGLLKVENKKTNDLNTASLKKRLDRPILDDWTMMMNHLLCFRFG